MIPEILEKKTSSNLIAHREYTCAALASLTIVKDNEEFHDIFSATTPEVTPGVAPEVTPEVVSMFLVIDGEMSRRKIMSRLGLNDEKQFREHYLQRAVKAGVIELTIPDKPNSRLQKYRLTEQGRAILQSDRQP